MTGDPFPSTFTVGPQGCADLSGGREWLVSDGAGGYAMGTVPGLRTRRYHALLVVPDQPAGGSVASRRVGLIALDATLSLPGGAVVPLGVHEWQSGAIGPEGHRHLELFELVDGLPRWRWRVGEVVLERELAMAHGRPSLGVVHRLVAGPGAVKVTLSAVCAWRDAHGGRRAGDGAPSVVPVADGVVVDAAYRLAGPDWQPRGVWWYGAYARTEAERGLDPVEDLWWAGDFTSTVEPGGVVEVSAWADDLRRRPPRATAVVAAARRRNRAVVAAAKPGDPVDAALALAADAFIVKGPDVVAGYPWHGCWPRDTLTAYEGLFLHTGRAGDGASLLRRQADAILRLPPGGDPRPPPGISAADGADAPLWLVHAVDRHVSATGDLHLGADLLPVLDAVLDGYAGDEPAWSARLDPADGLLAVPVDTAQATWMNAVHDGVPVTPRDGKPVDVNALWVNALAAAARLRERFNRDATALWSRHATARRSFGKRYPAPAGWLYDVVDADPPAYPKGNGPSKDDPVLRPNQLLAYALPYPSLDADDPRPVRAVGRDLLTPLGLRTLAPAEYGYRGTHAGPPYARDDAYHQGSAWPWLVGAYVAARRAVGLPTAGLLRGLEAHLSEWGIGSVSEVVDGDPPHRASGCPFSARSVAELIRARAAVRSD